MKYFGYEKQSTGVWCGVIYPERPQTKEGHLVSSNGIGAEIRQIVEIPDILSDKYIIDALEKIHPFSIPEQPEEME